MRKITVFHVDAFTTSLFGGNPAGVVLDGDQLSDSEMQQIANELNLPESVFLLESNEKEGIFKVKYFTPKNEIDFCGHATVALAWVLGTKFRWHEKSNQITFSTNIGFVPIDWVLVEDQLQAVKMTQVTPKVKDIAVSYQEITDILGLTVEDLDSRYPLKLGYTGNWHLLIPVKERKIIDKLKPNLSNLENLNRKFRISTTHLFTFLTEDDELDIYTRDFAPAVGIPEDPVTGSANGALAGYLSLENILSSNEIHELTIGQGHAMGRPGKLYVHIQPSSNGPIIQVAGSAVIALEGQLNM